MRSGIEVDISADHGGGGDSHGGDVQALMRSALARHAQLAPLAAVLKTLLAQRGLHEPYTGGLGSTKLYVLLTAWLDGPPYRSADLGQCLLGFLREHARRLPAFAAAGEVEADLSTVRVADCRAAFGEAAATLEARGRLRAVLDVQVLVGARQRSLRKAEGYTAALLSGAQAGGAAVDETATRAHRTAKRARGGES